jgi:predicted nucleic acid-binding protein
MLLPDVNVLVAAHRAAAPRHEEARAWLVAALGGEEAVALCLPVVSSLIRVGTTVVTYDRDFARFRDVRWCTRGESA